VNHNNKSRREFLVASGAALGGSWLALHAGAVLAAAKEAQRQQRDNAAWVRLSPDEARELAAIADQIYPPDDLPGAAEIGAVRFMDAAFGGFMAGALPMVREGLGDLARRSGPGGFASLDFDRQTAVLQAVEGTPFFGTVHFLTLCGLFALPAYGGNLDGAGWIQLGYQPAYAWQPPFGYYDAQVAQGGDDASA